MPQKLVNTQETITKEYFYEVMYTEEQLDVQIT